MATRLVEALPSCVYKERNKQAAWNWVGLRSKFRTEAMEVCGTVFRPNSCFSGSGIDTHSTKLPCSGSRSLKFSSVFSDNGHLHYYYPSPGCFAKKEKEKEKGSGAITTKNKLKLLKGLSKDLSMFSELGFGDIGLVGEVQGKMIWEAADTLLRQLQQLRAEEKELKRKKKQDKAKLKATQRKSMLDDESSSSESSESDCGEVVEVRSMRSEAFMQPVVHELQPGLPTISSSVIYKSNTSRGTSLEDNCRQKSGEECCPESRNVATSMGFEEGNSLVTGKRIEVCMGGKCKKSGAVDLLTEFERVIGKEGAVVGCKCMGKCRDGPNVRVSNCYDAVEVDSVIVKTPTNPLCIGVGMEDVNVIVANLFGENKGLTLAAAV